ncbi:MAG: OadG family protein [Brevefilum sp.]
MSDVMRQGLMITVIGMGLVFVVIIFLWWLMGLLVKVTTKKAAPEPVDADLGDEMDGLMAAEPTGIEKQRRAAAAAVAVMLALKQGQTRTRPGSQETRSGGLSPWQSVHRSRQLEGQHKRG